MKLFGLVIKTNSHYPVNLFKVPTLYFTDFLNFFCCFLVFYWFYIITTVSSPSSCPIPFPQLNSTQLSHGYQKIMAYQIAVRLSTSPFTEAEENNPLWGTGSQKSGKELKTAPVLTVKSPTRRSYTRSHICRGTKTVPCRLHGCLCQFRLCELP